MNEGMNGRLLHAWRASRGAGGLVSPVGSTAVPSPGQGYSSWGHLSRKQMMPTLLRGKAKQLELWLKDQRYLPGTLKLLLRSALWRRCYDTAKSRMSGLGWENSSINFSPFWNMNTPLSSWKRAVLLQELCFLKASYSLHHTLGVGQSPIPGNKFHESFSFLFAKWRFIILSTSTSLLAFIKLMNQLQSTLTHAYWQLQVKSWGAGRIWSLLQSPQLWTSWLMS